MAGLDPAIHDGSRAPPAAAASSAEAGVPAPCVMAGLDPAIHDGSRATSDPITAPITAFGV
ncbi:MAG: hypothetical protein J0H99_20345, partial [Rhodospirillales bacterium]|nr:hypothetical protein [Rhodospirillales bacterium]